MRPKQFEIDVNGEPRFLSDSFHTIRTCFKGGGASGGGGGSGQGSNRVHPS